MATEYAAAPAVANIARDLIAKHHPDLVNAPIKYVFRDEATRSKGRIVLGKARRIGGLNAFLADAYNDDGWAAPAFFVIEIAYDTWVELTPAQQIALVDHELAHLDVGIDDNTGEPTYSVIGHDIEEFTQVVKRHGMWRPEVRRFTEVGAEQLRLRLVSEETG